MRCKHTAQNLPIAPQAIGAKLQPLDEAGKSLFTAWTSSETVEYAKSRRKGALHLWGN